MASRTTANDAFSLIWTNSGIYMFPSFRGTIAKASRENTTVLIMILDWPTQYWYPQLLAMNNKNLTYFPLLKTEQAYKPQKLPIKSFSRWW